MSCTSSFLHLSKSGLGDSSSLRRSARPVRTLVVIAGQKVDPGVDDAHQRMDAAENKPRRPAAERASGSGVVAGSGNSRKRGTSTKSDADRPAEDGAAAVHLEAVADLHPTDNKYLSELYPQVTHKPPSPNEPQRIYPTVTHKPPSTNVADTMLCGWSPIGLSTACCRQ